MSLEHRWSIRKPVNLEAVMFYRPVGLMNAKIHDLSLEGLCLDTGRVVLPPNAPVELTFALNDGRLRLYQMDAVVIHRYKERHGLMFRSFKLDAFQAIHGMLYAAA